jgi:hypothetical protein
MTTLLVKYRFLKKARKQTRLGLTNIKNQNKQGIGSAAN